MSVRLWLAAACVVLALVSCLVAVKSHHAGFCAEDDPCWDCSTMGNHLCGPQVTR